MKKINKLFPIALSLLVSVFLFLSSCNKMDDIQREYADREEHVYLGKADSLKFFPGFNRAKLTWYMSSDPKIDRTIIYWNLRRDSIVKVFTRSTPGVQKDSVIIDNLSEGTQLFEFVNVNDEGETSLYSSLSVTAWGTEFANSLHARKVTQFNYDYDHLLFDLTLTPTNPGDSVVYSQMVYTNSHGEEKTLRIERDTTSLELEDFPDGGELRFRSVFFPPQGIDTVYNDYAIFKAPKAVFERGTKISLAGNMDSKYFERNDGNLNLYEWNTNGDFIVYALNADGSLAQTKMLPEIAPRSLYRDFFFYNQGKFIGISKSNSAVTMHEIIDDHLALVKATPAGLDYFGSGFVFKEFLPAQGYFYSLTAGTGDLKVWLAQTNATWGAPNGVTAGTGFDKYDPLILFNNQSLLGVDAEGYLWNIQVSVTGVIGSKSRIGIGWDRFKKMISVGRTLYCMEENGDFYVFNDFNTTDNIWIVN